MFMASNIYLNCNWQMKNYSSQTVSEVHSVGANEIKIVSCILFATSTQYVTVMKRVHRCTPNNIESGV
jgi:hypothetical protein